MHVCISSYLNVDGRHRRLCGILESILSIRGRCPLSLDFGCKMHKFPCLVTIAAPECNTGRTTNGNLLPTGREPVATLKIKVIFNNNFMF